MMKLLHLYISNFPKLAFNGDLSAKIRKSQFMFLGLGLAHEIYVL